MSSFQKLPMDIVNHIRTFNDLCEIVPINSEEEKKQKRKVISEILSPVIRNFFNVWKIYPSSILDILLKSVLPEESMIDEDDYKQFYIFENILNSLDKHHVINLIRNSSERSISPFEYLTFFNLEGGYTTLPMNYIFRNNENKFNKVESILWKVPLPYLCTLLKFMKSRTGISLLNEIKVTPYN